MLVCLLTLFVCLFVCCLFDCVFICLFIYIIRQLYLDMDDTSTPQVERSSPLPVAVAKQPFVKEECVKTDPRDVYKRTKDMKQELLNRVEEIGVYLPNNTLDELIDCLGGPSQVIIHIFTPCHSDYTNEYFTRTILYSSIQF